jgi:hypothetical protein
MHITKQPYTSDPRGGVTKAKAYCYTPAFYKAYVKLPHNDIPSEIQDNPHCYPFFKGCCGAADGSLLDGFVPMADMS